VLESISLDIANYWTSNDFLTESNSRCGTLVAFDWVKEDGEYYLTEINTNVDLSDLEVDGFKFNDFVNFLKKNNFTLVLGLRNVANLPTRGNENPSSEWTDELKKILKFNKIDYDEYMINRWPSPIPKFDVPDNVFILRYSYDEHSKIDQFAAHNILLTDFIEKSDWEKYYKPRLHWPAWFESEERRRVIVFCSDIENLILHENFDR
tara:strand:+ start:18 stop:638 length:621 start_codon:yes stop_codon:yes gene_type:complete